MNGREREAARLGLFGGCVLHPSRNLSPDGDCSACEAEMADDGDRDDAADDTRLAEQRAMEELR